MKSELMRPGQTMKAFPAEIHGRRDACHLPGVLVTSDYSVVGGQSVLFDGPSKVKTSIVTDRHGVADPFVKGMIEAGSLFWVFVDPELVEGLSHHFTLKVQGLEREPDEEYSEDEAEGVEEPIYDRYGSNGDEPEYCDWSNC